MFSLLALEPGFRPEIGQWVGVDAQNRVARHSEYPIGRVSRVIDGDRVEIVTGERPPDAGEVLSEITSR